MRQGSVTVIRSCTPTPGSAKKRKRSRAHPLAGHCPQILQAQGSSAATQVIFGKLFNTTRNIIFVKVPYLGKKYYTLRSNNIVFLMKSSIATAG
jgi:hypothetical protein